MKETSLGLKTGLSLWSNPPEWLENFQINTYVLEESENRPFLDENCKRQTANVKSGGKIVITSLFRSALSKKMRALEKTKDNT